MPTFEQLLPTTGFLTDRQITEALDAGFLLDTGSWERSCIRHASYTLRLGERVEIARITSNAASERKEFSVVRLHDGIRIDLKPGDTALLYSIEQVRLPSTVLGFTVARGLLFAEALCPENTYVDPGFTGTLYTTVTNVSSRIVQLEYGMPIARMFFFRLSEATTNGYRAGSAMGIAQQLGSVRAVPLATRTDCERASTADLLAVIGEMPMGGIHLTEVLRRQSVRQVRILTLAIVLPVLLVIVNNSVLLRAYMGGFAANVAASLVATGITFAVPKLLAWVRPTR
jgi:deoxycytidine triphosphate deaminase